MLEKQDNIVAAHITVERAIDELRRQIGIIIQDDGGKTLMVFPIEFMDQALLDSLRSAGGKSSVVLTGTRAKVMHLTDETVKAWSVPADDLSLGEMKALADPLEPTPTPRTQGAPATEMRILALSLAKYAALLPALFCIEVTEQKAQQAFSGCLFLHMSNITLYNSTPMLDVFEVAQANLPTTYMENAQIASFRSRYGTAVHLALVIGDVKKAEAPLVRVHSSCVTGDILGSLRCDCGDQLSLAMQQIAEEGCGVLVYLHQEGRGIGINNKLRAYQLQANDVDTYSANLMLGFEEDERDFAIASNILMRLGVKAVRLLTNNPHKATALTQHGTVITERVPLRTESGTHNHAYLDAKAKKSGHLL
jgi:GTP cyclohydrolase II